MSRVLIRIVAGVVFLAGVLAFPQDSASQAAGAAAAANAAVPRLIRFSGMLKDAAGKSHSGIIDVTFSLYREEAGGEALWFETQTVDADAQGRYTVLLGAMHPDGLPMDLFTSGEARWLGVSAGKLPEQPRILLVAVPYALKAADADTLGGKPATAFVASDQLKDQVRDEVKSQASQSGEGQGTRTLIGATPAPQAMGEGPSSFLCNLATDCVAVTQSGAGVGLHATTPTGSAVLGEFSGTVGAAVYGRATATTGAPSAVQGDAAAPNAIGVLGRAFAATGPARGVFGRSFSTSGIGVHGDATATTGATRGVWGTTVSTGGVGVWGQSAATSGFTTGVTGTVASPSGVALYGQAYAVSGAPIGVQAKVSSPSGIAIVADNIAGGKIFSGRYNGVEKLSVLGNGNLTAAGAISGASASFAGGVTAATFIGNGAGLTNVTAASATNADTLDGAHGAAFATLGQNVFVGNQTVTGNLSLTGAINSNGLRVEPTANTPNVINGDSQNWVGAGVVGATIAGGGPRADSSGLHLVPNRITHSTGTVGGGANNQAGDDTGMPDEGACCATVGGGVANKASGGASTIAGGYNNVAAGPAWTAATIGGGQDNKATNWADTVAGGGSNTAKGAGSTVGGGSGNTAGQWGDTVGGGTGNVADGVWATVPGGDQNVAGFASFAAGTRAKATSGGSFVWGDYTEADVTDAGWNTFVVRATGGAFFSNNLTVGGSINGGLRVVASDGTPNVIAGNDSNSVASGVSGAMLSGGGYGDGANRATDSFGTVGGGYHNRAGDDAGTTMDAANATVAGGINNTASGYGAFVGGGEGNTASEFNSAVGGGSSNTASGSTATVGGGQGNTASAQFATVAGGSLNVAAGQGSFAAGYRAKALHGGTFVWGDMTDADVESTGFRQFVARATGGFRFITGVDGAGIPQTTVGFEGASGNITTPGNVTAASFTGDGAGLTNVNAASAALATDALALGGASAGSYARIDLGNNFAGNQSIIGNLNLSGSFIGTRGYFETDSGVNDWTVNVVHQGSGTGLQVTTNGTADYSTAVYVHAAGTSGGTMGLLAEHESPDGAAVNAMANSTTGSARGVTATTSAPNGVAVNGTALQTATAGIGVAGEAWASTGNTVGVAARVESPDGVAGRFSNRGQGKILSGLSSGSDFEVFRVAGNGDVVTTAGDFQALLPGRGIILKSPDESTCARISLSNAGALVTTVITCP